MKWSRTLTDTCILGVILALISWSFSLGWRSTEHRVSGIDEVYFYSPYRLTFNSFDPVTKEYQVIMFNTGGFGSKARVFIDRGGEKGPNEVLWKHSYFSSDYDIEVHVSDMNAVKGDLVN